MISMPSPWLVLGALTACLGSYFYGHHKGWWERDAEMQIEIARKNEESRTKEREMVETLASKDQELRKANDVVNQKQVDLNRLIAAGRVRLPSTSCVQAPASAPAPSGNITEARAEPDRPADEVAAERETLRLIAQIAADGDKAINQLNACIDAYEAMRKQINGNN